MKNPRLFPSFLVAAAMTVLLLTAARADETKLTVDREGAVSHDGDELSLDELRDYARDQVIKDKQATFLVVAPVDVESGAMKGVMDALHAAGASKISLKQQGNSSHTNSDAATIKFSDPAKPGTLKISINNGDIHLHGADVPEIRVTTDLQPETSELRRDGLRVLTSSSSYSLTEKNNVAVLSYGTDSWPTGGGGGDFTITVPRNTAVIVNSNFGGDVAIGGITGNIEVKNLNGEVKLDDIDGAALVETMNGEIHATVLNLHEDKPLSFTSMNGEVALNLPADTKANVRLRTHNGSILTDFDDKVLVTKTESIRTSHSRNRAPRAVVVSGSDDNAEVRAAVREAVRAGAEAAREAAIAIKEATAQARESARDAARAAKDNARDNDDEAPEPVAPMAPLPPLPPMTGGKIVAGTLNGGGPEIRIATMNGDVTLRRIEPKK